MPIIPEIVLAILNAYLPSVLAWLSGLLYAELLRRYPDHFLVRLHQQLDFSPLEKACAHFHHTHGPGAPPIHTVPRLVRALLVGFLYNYSLRELECALNCDLLVKWFVGYRLGEAGPDHTTLARFYLWVCVHQRRTYFDAVLRQIDAQFPDERRQPQVGDTYAMEANAAQEFVVPLLRHAARRLLGALEAVDVVGHRQVLAGLDMVRLFGVPDECNEYYLDAAGRQVRLQTTVLEVHKGLRLVEVWLASNPALRAADRQEVEAWVGRVRKIMADEVAFSTDAAGQVVTVEALAKEKRGEYRLGSATDPEATYRIHGEDKVELGYNVNLAVSARFIREIRADTGSQPDAVGIPDLLRAQAEGQGFVPPKLIYDAAAGTGKTMAAVAEASEGRTQLVSPLIDFEKRSPRFGPRDFRLSADGACLTCPGGQESRIHYASGSGEGEVFRFFAQQCHGCPLWRKCREPKADRKSMRQVFISDYRPQVEAAQAYQKTEEYKADMKRRPTVERFIAVLVRYHGARRARRIGLAKADFQAKMCAVAFNLKQWVRLRGREQMVPVR